MENSEFQYKTDEIRKLFSLYKPKLQKNSCDIDALTSTMEEFAIKLKEIGGYKKAFTKFSVRNSDKANCLIIGRTPVGRFTYMLLDHFYKNGSILVKSDSGPLFEIEENTPEHNEYLLIASKVKELEKGLKEFEKRKQIP